MNVRDIKEGRVQAQGIMRKSKACWRNHREASQAGEDRSGQREQRVPGGFKETGGASWGAASEGGDAAGEGQEGWLGTWASEATVWYPGLQF